MSVHWGQPLVDTSHCSMTSGEGYFPGLLGAGQHLSQEIEGDGDHDKY